MGGRLLSAHLMRIPTFQHGATLDRVNGFARCRWGAALIGLLLAGCLQAGFGACSAEERAVFDSIRHFEEMPLEAEDHATGACGARFQTADPQSVLEHYEGELERGGWLIGTLIHLPSGVMQAQRGDMSFSVEIPLEGGDAGTVTVLVGEGL